MKEVVKCPVCDTEFKTKDYYGVDKVCSVCKTHFVFDAGIIPILSVEQKAALRKQAHKAVSHE